MKPRATGHTQAVPPPALHPCSSTERAIHKLLTDPAERLAQAAKRAETVGVEQQAFHQRIRNAQNQER